MSSVRNSAPLLVLSLMLSACGSTSEVSWTSGSQTILPTEAGDALYAVNAEVGTVSRFELESSDFSELDLGGEPTRLARAGDNFFVTLRTDGALAQLVDGPQGPELLRTVELGAEPFGVVVNPDETLLYVSLSMQDQVVELSVETLEVLRSWDVTGEPRWMAMRPQGDSLYVSSAMGGTLSRIDLDSGTLTDVPLPGMGGSNLITGQDIDLTVRITGDGAVSKDGGQLSIPTLHVDNISPAAAPDPDDATVGGYASSASSPSVGRFNPSITVIPLGDGGAPELDLAKSEFLAGEASVPPIAATVRSFPSAVTYSPDGQFLLASMEGSRTVVMLEADAWSEDDDRNGRRGERFGLFDFDSHTRAFITTDQGPRSIAFVGDDTYVHAFLDRTVSQIELQPVADAVQWDAGIFDGETLRTVSNFGQKLTDRTLAPELEEGRLRFFSAVDPQMVAAGAGVSCSTCHLDGRNDGLTWQLENGPRQTLSLAGETSLTAPFTWTNEVASVADEVMSTSQGRMGGEELELHDADIVAAYVDTIRDVKLPEQGELSASAERGQALFSELACASCHPAPLYTDNVGHTMFELRSVNTPTLKGIAATAPFMHDGSAATLRDALDLAAAGEMGEAFTASEQEMQDLEAFLRTL